MPVSSQLHRDLLSAEYYPELTQGLMEEILFDEEIIEHLVHLETHVDFDSIHRHLSVYALTPTRLLLVHVDDEGPAVPGSPNRGMTSVEDIPLSDIRTVLIGRSFVDPAQWNPDVEPVEVTLSLGWGAAKRIELFPENCGDPQCDADHGFSGTQLGEDVQIRVADQAEGSAAVAQAQRFAMTLKRLVYQARKAR